MKKAPVNPFVAPCGAVKTSPAAFKKHIILCEKCRALKSGEKLPPDDSVKPDPLEDMLHVTVIPPPKPVLTEEVKPPPEPIETTGQFSEPLHPPKVEIPQVAKNDDAITEKATNAAIAALTPLFNGVIEKLESLSKAQSPEAIREQVKQAVTELLEKEPSPTSSGATQEPQAQGDGGGLGMLMEIMKLFKGAPQATQPASQMREMFGFMSEFMGTFMKAYNDGAQSASALLSMGYKTGGDPAKIAEGLAHSRLGPELPTLGKHE